MSVARSVARSVAKSVARSVAVGESGGGAFDPLALPGLMIANRDSQGYEDSQLDGVWYRKSLEPYDSYRAPRAGHVCSPDGANDYLDCPHLTGSETVVGSEGTSTVTVAAGKLNFTAGTVWDVELSDGTFYPMAEESGTLCYDIVAANNGTWTNVSLPSLRVTSASRTANPNNVLGYSVSAGGVLIPAKSTTLDANDNPLDFTGIPPHPVRIDTPTVTGVMTGVTVSLGAQGAGLAEFTIFVKLKTGGTRSILYAKGSGSDLVLFRQVSETVLCYARTNGGGVLVATPTDTSLSYNKWYKYRVVITESSISLQRDNNTPLVTSGNLTGGLGALTQLDLLSENGAINSDVSVADFRWTVGADKKYAPLQEGVGTDVIVYTNGTPATLSGAITGGNPVDIRAVLLPGLAKDIVYVNTGTPSQYSRINYNPFAAAELNGRSVPTEYDIANDDLNATVTPEDSAFIKQDGSESYVYAGTLSASNVSKMIEYFGLGLGFMAIGSTFIIG